MSIFSKLIEEFLKGVPGWLRLLFGVELGTYLFFAYFFFASHGQETFRSVLLDFRWQVIALAEISAAVAVVLLMSVKRVSAARGKPFGVLVVLGAAVTVLVPVGHYALLRPRVLQEEKVDIFYLDDPSRVSGFQERVLRDLLREGGRKIRVSFNWPDWSESPPANLARLSAMDKLSSLAQKFGSTNPIGITSTPLDQDLFWIPLVAPGVNLAVISVADWQERFAPPSAEEYLGHTILLTTLLYRLNAAGAQITEHKPEDFGQFYFDRVVRKSQMKEVICKGGFKAEDEQVIRRALGGDALAAYADVLSFRWLPKRNCPE